MGKSYNNHIELAATPAETLEKIKTAVTDPARQRRNDKGHPDVCNIFSLHKFFNVDRVQEIEVECKSAGIGCVDCKKLLAEGINNALHDFRERRITLAKDPDHIYDILSDGAGRAQAIAKETIMEVKTKMGLIRHA
jgi:tryptophanyl-tRNA synthetase